MKCLYVLLAFSLLVGPALARPRSHYDMGPARRFTPEVGEEANFVSFSNGFVIDTRTGEPALPEQLRIDESFSDKLYYIVQLKGPVEQEWLKAMARFGIRPFGYLPHYAVLAKLDAAGRQAVSDMPFVNWVGLFQPAYKLEPGLLDAAGIRRFTMLVTPDEDAAMVIEKVSELGGEVLEVFVSGFGTTMDFVLDTRYISEIARLQETFWIQGWSEPTLANNLCQWVTQTGWQASAPPDTSTAARRVWREGVRGQGVILSATDTGLNSPHNHFRDPALSITPPGIWPGHRKVVAFKLYAGANAGESPNHGSHVNGTIAGDDSITGGTSYYDGMSIKARLYFLDVSNSAGGLVVATDLYPCWDSIYAGRGLPDSLRPIRQQSGSWGWSNSSGTYLLQDASTDAFCWANKDFLNLMAAGNESSTRRIRNPGIAKNVMTVGATQNGTLSNAIASFSSRGPTQDNRIKPNIVAPGVNIMSTSNTGTNTYQQMSGTSMATPAVNGAVGLIRCYLQEGYYPTGAPVPGDKLGYNTAALLRAMTYVSGDPNVGSFVIPSFDIGWGRIDVDSALYFPGDVRKLILCDDTMGLATGEYKESRFRVNSAIPLKVALAWTDTAAAPNANPTLVNDLNLELISPTGTSYRGNRYTSGQSTPNPTTWDSLNVEECARVNAPDTGLWTIKVYGRNVRTARKQWFAWAITGNVATPSAQAKDVGVTSIIAPIGQADSGTVIVPSAVVENFGPNNETFLTRFRIGAVYSDTQTVLVPAGQQLTVTFNPWTARPLGTFPVRCSTALAGDTFPGNDFLVDSVMVVPGTGIAGPSDLPRVFSMDNPSPNPLTRKTQIRFGLPKASRVRISVYSVAGTLIGTLTDADLPAGYHRATWNADKVASGIYLLRLETGGFTQTRKLVLDR